MTTTDKSPSRYPSRDPDCLHCKLNALIDEHYAQQGLTVSPESVAVQHDLLAAVSQVTAEVLSADRSWLTRLVGVFRFALTVQVDMAAVDRARARQVLVAGGSVAPSRFSSRARSAGRR